ncbi:MAG: class I SAM-dependent methyltransferase [Mesorhizobium sp.]|nr:MAG: class I SAM-dependent methyltransferase [Mesorhizobium sp.]
MTMGNDQRRASIVESESLLWGDDVAEAYHGAARRDMDRHWNDLIWPVLKNHSIDFTSTADFACGRGRNAEKLRLLSKEISLIDVNEENLSYCREVFSGEKSVKFFQCNGYDLSNIPDESFTFFYTFDSIVHFDVELILGYLPEFCRVLRPGGKLFVHHSNYSASPGADFRSNPHWRNFMSAGLFKHMSIRSGLSVLSQNVIDWGGIKEIDCLTTCVKPG